MKCDSNFNRGLCYLTLDVPDAFERIVPCIKLILFQQQVFTCPTIHYHVRLLFTQQGSFRPAGERFQPVCYQF